MQIPIDGGALSVCDRGDGPAVVFIHGFPLDQTIWDAQIRALSSDARCITLDLRGLGESSILPGPYIMEGLAGDLVTVLDYLRIERAVIVGHSLGGYVALEFFRMYAERVAGLALVASKLAADTPERRRTRDELIGDVQRRGIAAVIDAFLPVSFASGVYIDRPNDVALLRKIMERADPSAAVAHMAAMGMRVSSEDLVVDLTIPITVVAGVEDALMPIDEQREIAAALPDARLVELDGCGHHPMIEAPDATSAALRDLIARVRDTGTASGAA